LIGTAAIGKTLGAALLLELLGAGKPFCSGRAAALRGGHSQGDKPSAEILVAAGNSEGLGPTPRRSADRAENKNYYPFNGKLPAHGATSAIT
jgi:hypothetical protein